MQQQQQQQHDIRVKDTLLITYWCSARRYCRATSPATDFDTGRGICKTCRRKLYARCKSCGKEGTVGTIQTHVKKESCRAKTKPILPGSSEADGVDLGTPLESPREGSASTALESSTLSFSSQDDGNDRSTMELEEDGKRAAVSPVVVRLPTTGVPAPPRDDDDDQLRQTPVDVPAEPAPAKASSSSPGNAVLKLALLTGLVAGGAYAWLRWGDGIKAFIASRTRRE